MAESGSSGSDYHETCSTTRRYNNKQAVLLAYPGEGHGLRGMANRKDLTVRYFEFFDHYLKDAPAPKWLTEGVPYLKKTTPTAPADGSGR